jgi:hypothetical protein
MIDPRRSRNMALAFLALGLALATLYVALPKEAVQNRLLGIVLILCAPPALLFGLGSAIANHIKAKAQDKLVQGADVIARWRVDAGLWREFVALNQKLGERPGAPFNELEIADVMPGGGVEVLVGASSARIGTSFHELSPRSTPQITHARLDAGSRPSFVELGLYYPPYRNAAERRTVLRFPVAEGARLSAKTVVGHFDGSRPAGPA